jgi:hypothetical protein
MNLKIKSSLIIIFTLILGIFLGAIFTWNLLHHRVRDRIDKLRTPGGFIEFLVDDLELSNEQREEVKVIILEHFERVERMSREYRRSFRTTIDSLSSDLDPILTPEQKAKFLEKMKRGRGPMPPPGPPPLKKDRQKRK